MPGTDENLFQRREPAKSDLDRSHYPAGHNFPNPSGNQNSGSGSFNYNTSAKVVDYGHGNKQGI